MCVSRVVGEGGRRHQAVAFDSWFQGHTLFHLLSFHIYLSPQFPLTLPTTLFPCTLYPGVSQTSSWKQSISRFFLPLMSYKIIDFPKCHSFFLLYQILSDLIGETVWLYWRYMKVSPTSKFEWEHCEGLPLWSRIAWMYLKFKTPHNKSTKWFLKSLSL